MRPVFYFMKLSEYNREREQKFRLDAELLRLQTATLVNIHLAETKKIKPINLWKFPWDNEAAEVLIQMDQKQFEENYKKFINKRLNG